MTCVSHTIQQEVMMIDTAQAFGVDIGGSGIKAAPVDLNKGEFAEPRLKILTPSESTPQAIGSVLRKQLEHFEIPETAPVGISFPAPVKPGQKLNWIANLDQSWVGVDITEALSEECGRPVTVVNDADAAGLAEQQFGAAKGQEGLVVVTTLGTGIGTALIYDGVLIPNTELGHIELEGGKGDADGLDGIDEVVFVVFVDGANKAEPPGSQEKARSAHGLAGACHSDGCTRACRFYGGTKARNARSNYQYISRFHRIPFSSGALSHG